MRRAILLVVAVGFGVLAVVLTPRPDCGGGHPLTSLGHSLGGFRVLGVDVLFLRAERLRREGRVEEVPALYDAVLRLDPDNKAAAEYLAQVYAYDLLGEAPDGEARFSWWHEAWNTIERALARHPDDAALLLRSSDLLLEVAPRDPELEARVAARIPRARRVGITRLLQAARQTATLPRRGRLHLVRITGLLPVVTALELGEPGSGWVDLLREGRAILELRRPAFEETLDVSDEPGEGPSLAESLSARLDLVEAVGRARERGDRLAAMAAIDAWRAGGGEEVLADALQRTLE